MRYLTICAVALVMASPGYAQTIPQAPELTAGAEFKGLRFDWEPVAGATWYELEYKANQNVAFVKKGSNLAWMKACLSPIAHSALLDFLPQDLSSQKLNSVWELFQSSSIRFSSAPFLRPKQRWWRLLVHAIFEPILSRSCAVAI
jgi:hypothetical protein